MAAKYHIQYNEDQTVFSITNDDETRSTTPSAVPDDGRAHILFDKGDGKLVELFVTLVDYDGPCPDDTVFELSAQTTHVDTVGFTEEEEEAALAEDSSDDEDDDTPESEAVGEAETEEEEEEDPDTEVIEGDDPAGEGEEEGDEGAEEEEQVEVN